MFSTMSKFLSLLLFLDNSILLPPGGHTYQVMRENLSGFSSRKILIEIVVIKMCSFRTTNFKDEDDYNGENFLMNYTCSWNERIFYINKYHFTLHN